MPTKKIVKKPVVKKPVAKVAAKPAVKPVIKTAVKPAAKTVKAAAKKTVKTETKPVIETSVPVVETSYACCVCGCGCGRKLKKLFVLLVVFALGFAACHFYCGHKGMHFNQKRNMFIGECLDTSKLRSPEMAQDAFAADVDANGCITKSEWREWKKMK